MSQEEPNKSNVPDPEVAPRAKRRRFSAEYKLHILEEAEACSERGQIGSLLRRVGCTPGLAVRADCTFPCPSAG